MSTTWTSQSILALAPDAGSAKSSQELANPRKWVSLGASDEAVWGECQGSGSKPYQAQIDLAETAFKCSCPSRKFPCKHGLALFLLFAQNPTPVLHSEPPAWVSEWLTGRAQKAERRTQKTEEAKAAPSDHAAQAKRQAQREAKVSAGLEDLKRWLHDLVRQGMADLPVQSRKFWEAPAARLVDAQAPGAARLLRSLSSVPDSGEGWQERLLLGLAKLNLLVEGWEHRQGLSEATLADVRAALGWTVSQEEALTGEGVRDLWAVAGQHIAEEDQLRVQRTWLLGKATGRAALILQFAHGNQPMETGLVPGTWVDADLVFFPGAAPLRALVKSRFGLPETLTALPAAGSIESAWVACVALSTANPWLERFPVALQSVVIYRRGEGQWLVRDSACHVLPLVPHYEALWRLLAFSGGREIDLFGEWDGAALRPLGIITEERRFEWGI